MALTVAAGLGTCQSQSRFEARAEFVTAGDGGGAVTVISIEKLRVNFKLKLEI